MPSSGVYWVVLLKKKEVKSILKLDITDQFRDLNTLKLDSTYNFNFGLIMKLYEYGFGVIVYSGCTSLPQDVSPPTPICR